MLNESRSVCGKTFCAVQLRVAVGADALERRGNRGIIGRGGGKCFLRQPPLGLRRKLAAGFRHLFGDGGVIGGRSDDRHVLKILGRRADHRRPADINVFDQFFKVHAGLGRGLLKRVKIDDHHVDRLDAVLGHGGAVRGVFAAMQNSAVDFGMQRLHPPIEHFGKAGELGNVFHLNPASRSSLAVPPVEISSTPMRQLAGKVGQSGLIGDAENGALNLCGFRGRF